MNWSERKPMLAVLRGGARANPELADWIAARYGVAVVDVVEDAVPRVGARLVVWVRTDDEARSFRDERGSYDRVKQAAVGEAAGRPGVFVIFVGADRELRELALSAPGRDYTSAVAAVLDDPATLWQAYPTFGQLFVLLHTDAQVAALRGTPQATRVVDAMWELAHACDEFGILPRASLDPVFDSKQNVDENYAGSLGYYHR